MNHDEFMRRTLQLTTIPNERRQALASIGQAYLAKVRSHRSQHQGIGSRELRRRRTGTNVCANEPGRTLGGLSSRRLSTSSLNALGLTAIRTRDTGASLSALAPDDRVCSMGRIQTNADPGGSTICRLAASPARLALTSELLTTRNGTRKLGRGTTPLNLKRRMISRSGLR